ILATCGERHGDQRVNGARRADRLHRPGATDAREQVVELVMQVALEGTHLPRGGRVLGEELLRQAGDAERQAAHPERTAVLAPRPLDPAAAHVGPEVGPSLQGEGVAGGAEDEPRLVRTGDDLDGESGLAAQARDEALAVARLAHRAGSDDTEPLDAPDACKPPES